MSNFITKAQALSQIREAIDITRKHLKHAVGEEAAWENGVINGLQDALEIVKAIDSLDEVPDEDSATTCPQCNGLGEHSAPPTYPPRRTDDIHNVTCRHCGGMGAL